MWTDNPRKTSRWPDNMCMDPDFDEGQEDYANWLIKHFYVIQPIEPRPFEYGDLAGTYRNA